MVRAAIAANGHSVENQDESGLQLASQCLLPEVVERAGADSKLVEASLEQLALVQRVSPSIEFAGKSRSGDMSLGL